MFVLQHLKVETRGIAVRFFILLSLVQKENVVDESTP